MTTRTRPTANTRVKWIPGTRAHRQAKPLPVVNKPFVIIDEDNARLADWLNAYGYLVAKNPLWLSGLVPKDQIERVAAIVREQLANAKPNPAGKALALR